MVSRTVLITGASGFVGSHVVKATLDKGYNAVAIARGFKAAYIKKSCASYGDRLRVIEVDDIFNGQIDKEIFKGVDALIHVATPMPGKTPVPDVIPNSIKGTMNIIEQAGDAGVKSIVVTGTMASVRNPAGTFKNDDWNPLTTEQAVASKDLMAIYAASKKYAELAVWLWAEKHPEVEVTVLLPPFITGPYAREFFDVRIDNQSISNKFFYGIIFPDGKFPLHSLYIDVRDLAKAHVNAIDAPPSSTIGRKRVLFSSPHELDYKDVVKMLAEKRPQLKDRLNKGEPPSSPMKKLPCDFKRIEEVTGFRPEDFHTLEQTILDLLDDYLVSEEKWKAEGLDTTLKLPM
ncbi:NAD(P)-binding protein [Dendrothele bispora CBS 962.96]|uniref:NAD(P)-binding protein n=1 Tax=Dendrothele bispora (strain CBS 962.96) TaxID=1314807 RepID=A0A4S8LXE2_DENBC|nr:NAD(P)-binding protein [Dendrothele bispora CBS 962.96]